MSCINSNILAGASGSAGASPLYVDDVFSTFVYKGTGAAKTITNGINLGAPSESLNGKTITDTTGGGADYSKLINNIISSNNTDYYYGSIDCYIDYGSAVVSTHYDLYPQGDASQNPPLVYNSPASVTAYGSNNTSSWTTLGTTTFTTSDWKNGEPTKAVFTNLTAYRYYRLTVAGTKSLQEWRLGIGQAGEGGLVWLKSRSLSEANILSDTETGITKRLYSNSTTTQAVSNMLTSANSDGFSLGTSNVTNTNNSTNVSWTFRKAPGFFDVVTYAGTGSTRTVAHNLGSVPGMIIVKCLTTERNWPVWHRSISSNVDNKLQLNTTSAVATGTNVWGGTAPTATEFTLNDYSATNQSGQNFVAYIFAHDDASFGTGGNESIIKCASYTGNGGTQEINVGFEPQWLLVKNSTTASDGNAANWTLMDIMRGMGSSTVDARKLYADTTNQEANGQRIAPTATGFRINNEANIDTNRSGDTYVYMAIRRPNKPPTAATEVFAVAAGNGSNPIPAFVSNFTVDAAFLFNFNGGYDNYLLSRLTGDAYLRANTTEAQVNGTGETFDSNTGWARIYNSTYQSVMFKRTPGFFDVVTYTGTGSNISIPHNLGTIPELVIVKHRNASDQWIIFTSKIDGSTDYFYFNTAAKSDSSQSMPSASAINWTGSSSVINTSAGTYIAYLFATLPGISKVGSYSGTGNAINVPCGFTNGARFILIKRINGTGDWYLWDSLRGIVSGNDPYLLLNVNTTQTTNTDYVDPLSTGFTVTASAPAALNASGGTYLFLAIA